MHKAIKDVDAYIKAGPRTVQAKLRELRALIRAAAPEAQERISYSMPYYHYGGRLAYFAAARRHIGLYIPPPIIQEHAGELAGYTTARSTVQFPLDRPLPRRLITKLVKARMSHLESAGKKPASRSR